MDTSDRYDTGMSIRRSTMGDEYVDAALDRTAGTESARIQEAVTELVWGGVWCRPGLDRKTRSLLTVALLTALRAHGELAGHVRGALNNGASIDEITETIIHAVGYVGAPAGMSAMTVAQKVFDEQR
ncbi:carboxymuconolactone decarboxylase family protein [Gordonia sp. NPDC003424]